MDRQNYLPDPCSRREIRLFGSSQHLVAGSTQSRSNLCYACGSCLTACPVNLATDRLQPRKLVMMTNFGLIEELVRLPEIWYCLSCNRCNNACPMTVKPAALIAHLRLEAVRRSLVKKNILSDIQELQRQLHRVRAHVAAAMLSGRDPVLSSDWRGMAELPIEYCSKDLPPTEIPTDARSIRKACSTYLGYPTNLSECFTCSECRNACPVCHEPSVFDPMWMLRMMNLGFAAELLASPMMWLCIDCETCTHACMQRVRVHLFIRSIQQIALLESHVTATFVRSWKQAQKIVYSRFIEELDRLLLFPAVSSTGFEPTFCSKQIQSCVPAFEENSEGRGVMG